MNVTLARPTGHSLEPKWLRIVLEDCAAFGTSNDYYTFVRSCPVEPSMVAFRWCLLLGSGDRYDFLVVAFVAFVLRTESV